MTLLKGGVSHNVGSTGGSTGGFDPMSIAISEAKNEVDRKKQNISITSCLLYGIFHDCM